jgi:ABC-type phosphate/phosphonate transport system permease subunit
MSAVLRDPAAATRGLWLLGAAVVLWPLLVLTEFQPWTLFDARSLRVTGRFLAQFVPPRHDAEFLALLARETWRTVAIATAGMTLAMLLALPLALVPRRACAVLTLLALMLHLSLLNNAPVGAYFAQTLQVWEQGRFIRFNGLAQWLGWLWPYAALVYMLLRLSGPDGEN